MATVDELVNIAVDRADGFSIAAADAIESIDARRGALGYTTFGVDPSAFNASYSAPAPDSTPLPVYDDPGLSKPVAPTLVDLHGIDNPALPTTPTVNTAGLFQQVQPSSVMPDWNEANPALHTDEIYNELQALAAPVLADIDIPTIAPLGDLDPVPDLQLPDYEAYPTPEAIPATEDYAAYMQGKYDAMLPEMRAFVDDIVETWIATYAPEYHEQRAKLHEKLMAGMDNQVLPDQFEQAVYSRARARTESEFKAAQTTVLEQAAKGFLVPPAAVTSGLNKARLEGAKALSGQATEVYIERRKMEVQHLQFVMNLAANQIQSVRGLAMQYAQVGMSMIGQANQLADSLTQKLIVRFEHERSRREFSLAIMNALNEQYKVKLQAALSGLEGYKLNLEALRLQKDVEFKQIEGAKLQVETQQILVNRYSAMVDAIAKRVVVDELKIKEYGIRADIFKTNVQARLAAFEAYKAAIDGDKAKLQGELAKLQLYESQLKAATVGVEVQSRILDADVKTNAARLGQFSGELDAYRIASQVALQKFTAQAEIKRLGLDVYKTNVQANLEVYKGMLQEDIATIQARIEAFKGNVQSLSNYYRLEQGYTELDLKKTTSIADGYSGMAAAALQSLNSTVSSTISA